MVISAKSSCIEGAWEFARYFLTEEYQNSGEQYGLSVLKSVFEEKAYLATEKPYWTDENGEKIEYDNTFWINDEEMVIEQFTKEQVNQIIEFVYSVDKGYYYNTDVQNIIMEESEAYFSGQKSAEDVAKIIQSRVQIYVDENS